MKRRFLPIIALLLFASVGVFAQPANDLCQNATAFPALILGVQSCQNGTNLSANPEFPYPVQGACQPGGSTITSNPASDVWFSFVAVGNELVLNLTSTMTNANIGVYQGTCGSLQGIGCYTSNNGNIAGATFAPLAPGQTYFVQVSGGNVADTANFQLCLTNNQNTSICLNTTQLVVNPQPTNGTYSPGDTVSFCYSVIGYTQQGANWFHGITPAFGAGWILPPINLVAPASCDGQGAWSWYPSITSSATGQTAGFGCYYETGAGSPTGQMDNNPGNNYGDNSTTCTWTFCWDLVVDTAQGASTDLSIDITHYGDGQIGSWSSFSCTQDPIFHWDAFANPCPFPQYTATPTCVGDSNGTATIIGGGNGPLSYQWANGATTAVVSNLPAGPINVTVSDTGACSNTITVLVPNNPAMAFTTATTPSVCNTATGDATVNPSGGTAPYTYLWDAAAGAQTTQTAINLVPGTYTCYVSDVSCTDSISVTVSSAGGITATIAASTNVLCFGGNDGSATVNVTGSAGPYQYQWLTSTFAPVPNGTGTTVTGLTAGTYYCAALTGGCADTATVVITEPPLLTIQLSATDATCNGLNDGTATVVPSGGAGGYSYLWTPGSQITQTAISLFAGTYNVTVTDQNGCTESGSISLTEPTQVFADAGNDVSFCAGSGGVNLDGTATGGTGTHTFSWTCANPPCGLTDVTDPNTNCNPSVTNTYFLTVTDQNGCTSAPDDVEITVVQQPVIDLGPDSTLCTGQGIGLYAGNPGATYLWSTGETNANINVNSPGTYSVTVAYTAGNGQCTATDDIIIGYLEQPVVDIGPDVDICRGESHTLNAGSSNFSYAWSNGIIDTDRITVWEGGWYTVTVKNGHCIAEDRARVYMRPNPVFTFAEESQTFCREDGIEVKLEGPSGPGYQYLWNTGEIWQNITPADPGVYTLTVFNAYGCEYSDSTELIRDCNLRIFIPNAFTPNGDNMNDIFMVYGALINSFSMNIYDRWGNEVFATNEISQGWDGRIKGNAIAPEGVYTYIIKFGGLIGSEQNFDSRAGTITLIR